MTAPRPDRAAPGPGRDASYHRPRRPGPPPRPPGAPRSGGDRWAGPTTPLRAADRQGRPVGRHADRDPVHRDPEDRERRDRLERRGTADAAGGDVRLPWPLRALRAVAGVLAGGLVVLALGITVVFFVADSSGFPGPGTDVLVGHWVGAVVAVVGQRIADRRPDRTGTLAALAVVVVTTVVLGVAWFL